MTMKSKLLARRVPREEIIPGRAYVIHARNGGVGIAVLEASGTMGYELRRYKFGDVYLFVEVDWDDCDSHGTAIPLRLLPEEPPAESEARLQWLAERESECRDEVEAAWRDS